MSRGLSEAEASHPDRQRVHRAARQGAADGIRRRDEQAHPAPDGRLGRLTAERFSRHAAIGRSMRAPLVSGRLPICVVRPGRSARMLQMRTDEPIRDERTRDRRRPPCRGASPRRASRPSSAVATSRHGSGIAAGRPSPASRATPWPTSRDEEWRRTDIRGAEARRLRPADAARALGRGARGVRAAPGGPSIAHYGTGIAQLNAVAVRAGRRRQARRGASSSTSPRAVKEHPELLRAPPADRRRRPDDGRLLGPARGLLDRRDAALRPQGGEGRGPAVQPGRPGRREGRVDLNHTLVVLEEGAEATLVRRRPARGRGDDAGPARRRGRAVRRARGQAPVRQHPELGRRHLALQPRAGPGRARRRAAVDRRRPRARGWPRSTRRSP